MPRDRGRRMLGVQRLGDHPRGGGAGSLRVVLVAGEDEPACNACHACQVSAPGRDPPAVTNRTSAHGPVAEVASGRGLDRPPESEGATTFVASDPMTP